jgi:hypothetical protein
MAAPVLAPVVSAFLARHVRNLDDLHLLMSMIQSGDRWWDVASAAREFGLTPTAARAALDRFAAQNLLDLRLAEDVRYQFCPGTEELRAAARETLDAYRTNPIAVARAAMSQTGRGITDFADAFRIRRDDDR